MNLISRLPQSKPGRSRLSGGAGSDPLHGDARLGSQKKKLDQGGHSLKKILMGSGSGDQRGEIRRGEGARGRSQGKKDQLNLFSAQSRRARWLAI